MATILNRRSIVMVTKVGVCRHPPEAASPEAKRSLSPNERRLLERMQRLGFGTIRGLHVRAGEPQFDPPFEVSRTWLSRGRNAPRPEVNLPDFTLKDEQANFFREVRAIGDGVIDALKVQEGLPIGFEMRESM
jgi:hypothetical protein